MLKYLYTALRLEPFSIDGVWNLGGGMASKKLSNKQSTPKTKSKSKSTKLKPKTKPK